MMLPVDPMIHVSGFFADEATIFKSALNPLLLPFKVVPPPTIGHPDMDSTSEDHDMSMQKYGVIFKVGDDIRQDQLVMQLIRLMDKLLQRDGLDLKLTPYHVLASGMDNGMVEAITPNTAIAKIAKGDIRAWLKKHNPHPEEYQTALQNFVKSCAGYTVITYILGIGDRHLDNILLTPEGKLFHIGTWPIPSIFPLVHMADNIVVFLIFRFRIYPWKGPQAIPSSMQVV